MLTESSWGERRVKEGKSEGEQEGKVSGMCSKSLSSNSSRGRG